MTSAIGNANDHITIAEKHNRFDLKGLEPGKLRISALADTELHLAFFISGISEKCRDSFVYYPRRCLLTGY